jgi:hypothetical protein
MELVGKYNLLSLTYESDRLAALSDLAATFETKHLGRYIAGTWIGVLPCAPDWVTSQNQKLPLT